MILAPGSHFRWTSGALKIDFDPARITYEELLEVFFKEHMPTRRAKEQYKSAASSLSPMPPRRVNGMMLRSITRNIWTKWAKEADLVGSKYLDSYQGVLQMRL
ncbi:hypothetical protein CYMTET_29058 [Cymbomonas tetramitiformis]|uniref:peptide-methionine (S)-S-oxide reductase n=1 Tax=Cymbomonas tetramitiformis TaxID=36881 RepID=A0AAE0KVB8_9CHLO|nr:hypothetical protein CYMTET_29058 [Cymbomonas tetramitiformis]